MAILITLQGPDVGRKYSLDPFRSIIGRQFDSTICLPGRAVSRQHAQLTNRDEQFFVEDLESSNGTFVNGQKIPPRKQVPLTEKDTVQVGPYLFALRPNPTLTSTEPSLIVREEVALTVDQSVYRQDPALKLQVVLEIAQNLARTLDMEPLLDKLLEQLMRLFPQADRAMVLLCEDDNLVVRGQRSRREEDSDKHPYSRTIVKRALDEGLGILSEDVRADERFNASSTLTSLDLHSLLCVPLIAQDGKRLGILQVDRFRKGMPFRSEDLQLLSTISLQVGVALENAALHAERLREERLHQELSFAREIQQGFLPDELEGFDQPNFDIFGCVYPARQVAGDLYDFFRAGNRLAFFIGDVSGKGMPAALFMVATRILCRHLASAAEPPAVTLGKLNDALAADNPSGMFVTLLHGVYDPDTGDLVLASGGHPPPIRRRADGTVEDLTLTTGRLLGFEGGDLHLTDYHYKLDPGDTLLFFTDGVTEARTNSVNLFGRDRIREIARDFGSNSLQACAELLRNAVSGFTHSSDLQDDFTVLLLRRLS